MHHTRCALFGALIILLSTTALAEERSKTTAPLTLEAAIKTALASNPRHEREKVEYSIAKARRTQAGLWQNPELFMEAEEWPADGAFEDSRYKVGLAQTFPYPGKMRLETNAADSAVAVARAELSVAHLDLIKRVQISFYRVLSSKKLLEIASTLQEVAHSSTRSARARLSAGEANEQEVLRAEIQLERLKSEVLAYKQAENSARTELAALLGEPHAAHLHLEGELHATAPRALLDMNLLALVHAHPAVLAADLQIAAAEAALARASLEGYPDITLSIAGGRREVAQETLLDVGISLPLPLHNSGQGARAVAAAQLQRARAHRRQIELSLQTQLKQQTQALSQLDAQVKRYRDELLPRAERALQMVQTGFREGQFAFNDLLDTQRTTAEMRLIYQRTLFELNRNIAEVEALISAHRAPQEQS